MDRKFYICAILVLMCLDCVFASAQGGYTGQGTVKDQYGPLIGAAVVKLSTSN